MGVTSKAAGAVGKQLGPRIGELAPGLTTSFVREALHRAIAGVGPLPPAARAADAQLKEQKGDVERAVHEVIENHVRYAGAQGFVTNLGGVVTMALTIPTNITGLALIQSRMIAGIAHLRGYDLEDPRVRNAILTTMLGEDVVDALVRKRKLPAPPMALATAPHPRSPPRQADLRRGGRGAGDQGGRQAAGHDGRAADPDRRRLHRAGCGRLHHLAGRPLRRP